MKVFHRQQLLRLDVFFLGGPIKVVIRWCSEKQNSMKLNWRAFFVLQLALLTLPTMT